MSTRWVTPELLVLQSGAEAASPKIQPHPEGVGDSCPADPGVGCPGTDDIVGPS
jgi:hypothetical protein